MAFGVNNSQHPNKIENKKRKNTDNYMVRLWAYVHRQKLVCMFIDLSRRITRIYLRLNVYKMKISLSLNSLEDNATSRANNAQLENTFLLS